VSTQAVCLSWLHRRAITFLAIVLLLGCALAFVSGAEATTNKLVGSRISLFGGASQTFPAGQPFHINHGWQLAPGQDSTLGGFGFSLAVDGVVVKPDFIDTSTQDIEGYNVIVARGWFYNFPSGMTGSHTFTGIWSGPCEGMVAVGFATGPCADANAIITSAPLTITITFVP
jgi:hypothetical protein